MKIPRDLLRTPYMEAEVLRGTYSEQLNWTVYPRYFVTFFPVSLASVCSVQ